jgi:hypothetical protein
MLVPRNRERQAAGRPGEESSFPIELRPMIRVFREPEDELIVHAVRPRAPTLSEQIGGADREARDLAFNLSPVRVHGGPGSRLLCEPLLRRMEIGPHHFRLGSDGDVVYFDAAAALTGRLTLRP